MIHIFGDIILDKYVECEASRISQEAPVLVLHPNNKDYRLGGAANVALNVKVYGEKIKLYGIIGTCECGEIIKKKCKELDIANDFLILKDEKTVIKTRYLSSGQQVVRVDEEKPFNIKSSRALFEKLKTNIVSNDLLILSDYGKGSIGEVEKIIAWCNKKKIKVLIDPKGNNFLKYSNTFLLTPNRREFENVAGVCNNEIDFNTKAHQLRKELNLNYLLVKRDKEGMTLYGDKDYWHFNANKSDVIDVTGAGDTVIATLAFLIQKNVILQKACYVSTLAAASVISQKGVTTPKQEDIKKILKFSGIETKKENQFKISLSIVKRKINAKRAKQKIVFTNGCFDLIHAGHIKLLTYAKASNNFLIVGLNSDLSISKIKGLNRPINNLYKRFSLLKTLPFVDVVIPFDEETPLELIMELRPDILIKGADYEVEKIIGYDFIKSYGGSVDVVPIMQGFSSSSIIESMEKKKWS